MKDFRLMYLRSQRRCGLKPDPELLKSEQVLKWR
jgi:hypothetical protein